MKTVLTYILLIAAGFGIGTYGRKLWLDYRAGAMDRTGWTNSPVELTSEQETLYRRSRTRAYELLDNADRPTLLVAALGELEKMIDMAPHRSEGHLLYAGTGLRLLRWRSGLNITSSDAANLAVIEDHVRQAAQLNPEDFDVMLLTAHWRDFVGQVALEKGEKERGLGEIQGALDILERAAKMYGHDKVKFSGLLLERATLLRHMGRYREALEKLELARNSDALQSQRATIHLNMALLQDALDNEAGAVANYEEALRQPKPPVIDIFRHRAMFYEKRGYTSLALDDLRILHRLIPDSEELAAKISELEAAGNP